MDYGIVIRPMGRPKKFKQDNYLLSSEIRLVSMYECYKDNPVFYLFLSSQSFPVIKKETLIVLNDFNKLIWWQCEDANRTERVQEEEEEEEEEEGVLEVFEQKEFKKKKKKKKKK